MGSGKGVYLRRETGKSAEKEEPGTPENLEGREWPGVANHGANTKHLESIAFESQSNGARGVVEDMLPRYQFGELSAERS